MGSLWNSTLLVSLLFLLTPSFVKAQNTQLWFARYGVNEAGWQIDKSFEESTHRADMTAMARALMNNYRRSRVHTWMIRGYGDNVFNRNRTNRRYIPFLRPFSSRPPRHWARADWRIHRPRFDDIYRFSGRILRGEEEAPSTCQPHHWGAPWFGAPEGWKRQDCGNTANAYWCVPTRDECP